jgi:hypothetical protein
VAGREPQGGKLKSEKFSCLEMTAPRPLCVAGVVGLELRNPLGSKSAGVAAGSSGDLAETAQQRLFAFELRCGGHAAAASISAGVAGMEGGAA